MKYALPFVVLASPVAAHPVNLAHTHSADAVVFGLALIAIAGAVALIKAKVRK